MGRTVVRWNRFNSFPGGGQTVETVGRSFAASCTPLKRGVNENGLRSVGDKLVVLILEHRRRIEDEDERKSSELRSSEGGRTTARND